MDVFQKSSFFFLFQTELSYGKASALKKTKNYCSVLMGHIFHPWLLEPKWTKQNKKPRYDQKNKKQKKTCISQERPLSGKLVQIPERVCPAETLVRRPCVRCSTAAATTSSRGGQCKWSRSSNGMAENKDTLHATCGNNMMMCAYILCMCRMISGSVHAVVTGQHGKEGNASADTVRCWDKAQVAGQR